MQAHKITINKLYAHLQTVNAEHDLFKMWLIAQIHESYLEDEDYRNAAITKEMLEKIAKRAVQ
ncbi:MAG: hypothetical protein KDC49_04180 [Saprospiraceae bacterium]|nr:hypothetical protein [Saprospiraceae bacterium]